MRLDVVAIAAGLLHDVVEDTLTTIERIQELFGPEVAHVVEGVTKLGAIPFSSKRGAAGGELPQDAAGHGRRHPRHHGEARRPPAQHADAPPPAGGEAASGSPRRRSTSTRPSPTGSGMSKIKNELEELALQVARAQGATRPCRPASRPAASVTEGMIEELHADDRRASWHEAQVPVRRIDGRIKRLYSIHLKLQRQKIELEQVYDLVALRIVTPSRSRTATRRSASFTRRGRRCPGRIKDFIAMPRPNGYQSLHTSVVSDRGLPFEVQIRTEEMHRIAEEGIAAHWKYKEGRVGAAARRAVFPLAAAAARMAAGGARPAGVHPEPEDRPLSGGGLHLHAARRGEGAAARRHADRFRLRDSHRHRPPVRRRPRQRQDGAAAPSAEERRHRRDRDAGRDTSRAATGSTSSSPRARARRSSTSSTREEKARSDRARPEAVREGGQAVRRQRQGARRRARSRQVAGRVRLPEDRRPARRRSATARCRPGSC